jgi:hypothetical protein
MNGAPKPAAVKFTHFATYAGLQVALTTTLCTVFVYLWGLSKELGLGHPAGASNSEMAPGFLENVWSVPYPN